MQSRCPAVCKSTVSTFKKNFQGPVNANEMIQWGKFGTHPRQAFCRGSIGRCAVVTGTGATSRLIEQKPRQTSSANHGPRIREVCIIAWHHEITTREATPCDAAREIRGMGGTWRPNTSPQTKPRVVHGTGRGYVYFGSARPISRCHVQYCRPFQITVYCTKAAGRRSTRDTISALHAADACRLPALRH